MRYPVMIAFEIPIPLHAKRPAHPSAPLDDQSAGARNAGQGRPQTGARALPFTGVSTLAGLRRSGDRTVSRYAVLLIAGALSVCAGSGIAVAQAAPIARTVAADSHAAHIADAARRFRIPAHWIVAVLRAESAGDPRAVSSAGAMGLMQVMPDTWAELRARHRLGGDPFDVRDNIMAGTAYLREMLDRYGTIGAMLAAYNAGPGRYDEYVATGRALPPETRAYVAALAPLLGAEPLSEGAVSPPPVPADWREAPLFIARSIDAAPAPSLRSREDAAADPAAVPPRANGEVSTQDGILFVPLGAGDRP